MIFPVENPVEERRSKAAKGIIQELQDFGAAVVPFEEQQRVIELARPA
jgi:hypothetical protein